ncbi:hypothetical protein SEA_LIBERTYBELL_28 [Streptomyces phage LibertyBell]|nr:hypothetical protein SEA_LIBERTYBELL_28 [Streptomyces phage LibertyBell]
MRKITIPKRKPTDLENELARLLDVLKTISPTDPDYAVVADQLKKLYPLKETDSKNRVSKDILVSATAGLAQVLMIIGYEHAHPLTSKAMNFVFKR